MCRARKRGVVVNTSRPLLTGWEGDSPSLRLDLLDQAVLCGRAVGRDSAVPAGPCHDPRGSVFNQNSARLPARPVPGCARCVPAPARRRRSRLEEAILTKPDWHKKRLPVARCGQAPGRVAHDL